MLLYQNLPPARIRLLPWFTDRRLGPAARFWVFRRYVFFDVTPAIPEAGEA